MIALRKYLHDYCKRLELTWHESISLLDVSGNSLLTRGKPSYGTPTRLVELFRATAPGKRNSGGSKAFIFQGTLASGKDVRLTIGDVVGLGVSIRRANKLELFRKQLILE